MQKDDIILAISYSGETDEVCSLVPHFKRIGTPIIAITGESNSTLAKLAHSHINASVKLEACLTWHLQPALRALARDALAVVLLEMRDSKQMILPLPTRWVPRRRLFVKVGI